MKVVFGETGITFSKFFMSRTIPYSEIYSISVKDSITTYTTRSGEEFWKRFFSAPPELYKAIVDQNIIFRNEDEIETGKPVYTRDKIDLMIEDHMPYIQEVADAEVKKEFGLDYTVALKVVDNIRDISLSYAIFCEGEVVIKDEEGTILAFLVEWDPTIRSGRYGVPIEMENKTACKSSIVDDIVYLNEER